MKRIILVGSLLICGATKVVKATDINFYIAPYLTYINYSNSDSKESGYDLTVYGSISINKGFHVVEWSIGHTLLNFKNSTSDWNQSDYVLSYTNYQLIPWYGKIGIHYIATPNEHVSKGGKVFFMDLGYVKKYKWNTGLEYTFSDYKYGVNLNQVKLHSGFYIWKNYYTGFYFDGFLGTIHINKSKWTADMQRLSKKNYYYAGIGGTYFTSNYSLSLNISLGKRIFEVDKGGFVVYNLKEPYTWRLNLQGKYYFNKKFSVSGNLGFASYKEDVQGQATNEVKTYVVSLSVGYHF
ncbi:MAG TPA: hypothetical protein EYG91_04675 [Aquifex aeolicus]|nr:hypothetical protein [Aquifex aeolicus]